MKTSIESTYKNRGRLLGFGSGPDADWRVMFSLFLVLLMIALISAFILFGRVGGGEEGLGTEVESPVNEAALRRTANYYEKQKLDFESAKSVPETIPDPSI